MCQSFLGGSGKGKKMGGDISELMSLLGRHNQPEEDDFSGNKGADALSLRELVERYEKGVPFKRGDLVTPRRGYNLRGEGHPCVVLDVFPQKWPTNDNGGVIDVDDMRIGRIIKGRVIKVYAEAVDYEHYTGPVAP